MACSIIVLLRVFSWESREALRKSELRFHAVIENSPVTVFIEDRELAITFIHGKALENIGVRPDDVIGKSIQSIFPESPRINECELMALEGKSGSLSVTNKDFQFNVSYAPLCGEDGTVEGVVGIAVDVTELAKAHTQLDDYRAEMLRNKTLVTLGTIGTAMTERLEEPLTAIRDSLFKALKGLRKTIGAEMVKNSIEEGLGNVNKAFGTVNNFYAQADITPLLKAEPIDLQGMVERIVEVFEDSARLAMLRIITRGVDIMPCMFMSPQQLEQVFFVLIQHSIQAADGETVRNLNIDCSLTDGKLVMEFSDGFDSAASDEFNRIFESFPEETSSEGVSRFGLAILGRLVKANDGTIEARKESDDRAVIIVSLPAEKLL